MEWMIEGWLRSLCGTTQERQYVIREIGKLYNTHQSSINILPLTLVEYKLSIEVSGKA